MQVLPPPSTDNPLEPAEAFRAAELIASAKRRFQFSVFDLPPALYAACKDAALLADRVFVVCSADRISLHLAERRVRDLMQLGLAPEQIKLIVNCADSGSRLEAEQIPDSDGIEAIAALPNDYRRVSDAYRAGDLVDLMSPYRQGADALAERIFRSL